MMGMFLDRPLLDWLQKYTFPNEARFADAAYAEKVYPHVIRSTLENGTTTAAYFDTIFTDSTLILANQAQIQARFESFLKGFLTCELYFLSIPIKGQRAFVGKVNMDLNELDPSYKEASMQESYKV